MGLKKEKEKKSVEPEKAPPQNDFPHADGAPGTGGSQEEGTRMLLLPADEVEKMKTEAIANLENWKRERADFVNYKKIIERDEKLLRTNIKIDLIKKYLPILDDLELALKALPEDSKEKAWFSGIDLIYRKLQLILENEGVTRISAEEFNPTIHEAVTFEVSPNHNNGEIIEIVKQGYMLSDRVLRPAQVRVAQ